MPFKNTKITLTSAIFDSSKREGVISRGLTRKAKQFKKVTVDDMVASPATGRTYKKGTGQGFTRSHTASSRGNPPRVDRGNLIRQVKDVKISTKAHEVYVDDAAAPYGAYLERPRLARTIMSPEQVGKFEKVEGKFEDERMAAELAKG